MRVIWKFPLSMRGWNAVPIGPDAKVVLAAIDPASGAPAIWVEHEPADPAQALGDTSSIEGPRRHFGVFPTGGSIAEDADHVGSMIDRTFVWHIYERRA